MRKSFEKYLQESSIPHNKNTRNQRGGEFITKFKYIIIGFTIGIFFVASISYASGNRGTIGALFNFLSSAFENGRLVRNVYRLDGANIRDKTVTHYELADGTVKTRNVGNLQITKDKLAPNSVDASKITSAYTRNFENKIRTLENKINTIGGKSCGVYRYRFPFNRKGNVSFHYNESPYQYKVKDIPHLHTYRVTAEWNDLVFSGYNLGSVYQCIDGTIVTLVEGRTLLLLKHEE